MRDIKFRAYDKRTKIMFIVGEMFWLVGGISVDDGASTEKGFSPNDFEIMQYTGLKDRNGKEIYEGDIVNLEKIMPDGTKKNQVSWITDGWAWGDWNLRDSLNKKGEVIGNIWENPDLLSSSTK